MRAPNRTEDRLLSWLLSIVGAFLVLAVLRDVFHTLFHPAGQGTLAQWVFRATWTATAPPTSRARALAGPLAMVLVIALWTLILVIGWALIYWAAMPANFIFASALNAEQQDGFIDALYFAWVTQSTLGFGDIAPTAGALRVLVPLQATIGFGLFTVAVTWVLSIYPALKRQRGAASLAHAIRESHDRSGLPLHELPQAALARQFEQLAEAISSLRVDYLQYTFTFYFAPPGSSTSLAAELPQLYEIAHAERLSAEAALAAHTLASSIDSLAQMLSEQFLPMELAETRAVLGAVRDREEH